MSRFALVLPDLAGYLVLWQQCGENLPLFCYRIGMDAFAFARSRAVDFPPLASIDSKLRAWTTTACSRPSANSSIAFTTYKD
jgi:hypothetical protein